MCQKINAWGQREEIARKHGLLLRSNMRGVGEDHPAIVEMSATFGRSPRDEISDIEADYTQLAGLNSL